MRRFLNRISISRRLLLAFLLAATIPGIVISILGFSSLKEQHIRSQAVQRNISIVKTTTLAGSYIPRLKELLTEVYQDQYASNSPILKGQLADKIEQVNNLNALFAQTIALYQRNDLLSTSPDMYTTRTILLNDAPDSILADQQQRVFNHLQSVSWPAYKAAQQQLLQATMDKIPLVSMLPLLQQTQNTASQLEHDWNSITLISTEVSNEVARVGPAQANPLIITTIVTFIVTIIVVALIGYFVYLTITQPLNQLAQLTKRIARGDTTPRADVKGNDEISQVAQSMNTMLDNIVQLIYNAQTQRDMLQTQVEKLVSEVSGVGEGDLRIQAEVTTDALGVLADSFNYMVEELGSLVVRVKLVSREVDTSTITILDRMTRLVEIGNKQIRCIAEIEAEIEHMTGKARQAAEHSQVLYDVARVARQDAQAGRESVTQAIDGMGRINQNVRETSDKVLILGENSREINEIVEAISGIAHQTNRLALDAAIQAAMAGEHGKGFGAVAADIRRLAERSKDQATMITRIVRNVREEIESVAGSMLDTQQEAARGTQLTQDAGTALEAIFAAVEHQAREIEQINQMISQQLHSSNTIVHVMRGVSNSTQESCKNTHEASQHMERLSHLVEQLRVSVETFKLRDNHNYYVPNTNTTIITDEDDPQDTPLTVSGIFRKVKAATQSVQISRMGMAAATTPTPESMLGSIPPSNLPNSEFKTDEGSWDWNSAKHEAKQEALQDNVEVDNQ